MQLKSFLETLFSTGARRPIVGWLYWPVRIYTALFSIWVLWAATLARVDVLALTVIFLSLIFVPTFILIGATAQSNRDKPSIFDWVLSALALACAFYFIIKIPETANRISLFDELNIDQFIFASILIFLTLEITRRTVGLFLMLLVIAFITYNLFGDLIGGSLGHGVITIGHFVDINIYTTDGLFGIPVRVAATYAFLFVMFGTFLEKAKGGDFFFGLAASISGRSVGGPAKIAVVSSALFGTMSGSPTSDVVATGSITIPMMKKLGYDKNLAAGVEVASSTGGSLLPPVMGSAAFIMAELIGVGYAEIVVAAILPAILYYVGIIIQVHLRSRALNLAPLSANNIPTFSQTMKDGWPFLIPLMGLVVLLIMGYSPTMVAVFCALGVWVVSYFKASTRLNFKATVEALSDTTIRMMGVTGACAAAGLVIGGITMTGLASKFSFIAFALAGDSTLLVLLVSALVTIILGLGMPTPSAYVLAAVLVGPTLVNDFGFPELNIHLFLLYFAVMSAMTPPVAVAAYAASAISGANPLKIAVVAMRFSIVAFVVPFLFVLNPATLHPFESFGSILIALSIVMVCIVIAVASEIHWNKKTSTPLRLAMIIGALLLATPDPIFKIIGFILSGVLLIYALREFTKTYPLKESQELT